MKNFILKLIKTNERREWGEYFYVYKKIVILSTFSSLLKKKGGIKGERNRYKNNHQNSPILCSFTNKVISLLKDFISGCGKGESATSYRNLQ